MKLAGSLSRQPKEKRSDCKGAGRLRTEKKSLIPWEETFPAACDGVAYFAEREMPMNKSCVWGAKYACLAYIATSANAVTIEKKVS